MGFVASQIKRPGSSIDLVCECDARWEGFATRYLTDWQKFHRFQLNKLTGRVEGVILQHALFTLFLEQTANGNQGVRRMNRWEEDAKKTCFSHNLFVRGRLSISGLGDRWQKFCLLCHLTATIQDHCSPNDCPLVFFTSSSTDAFLSIQLRRRVIMQTAPQQRSLHTKLRRTQVTSRSARNLFANYPTTRSNLSFSALIPVAYSSKAAAATSTQTAVSLFIYKLQPMQQQSATNALTLKTF